MTPERAQELLDSARRDTEARLARLRGVARSDDAEAGDASAESDEIVSYETDAALESLLERRLEAIARAEVRLRDGTYGRSIRSGEQIPDGRLEIEPWAELTVAEQSSG